MIFFVFFLLLCGLSSFCMAKPNEFHRDYLDRNKTTWVKGVFVYLIVLSHGKEYIYDQLDGVFDHPYFVMQNQIHQMVVAMFLFYSGYGIMEQIKKRRFGYIKSIPTKRFPNLLLNYDIAVFLFLVLSWYMGKHISVKRLLVALVAWNGIGNSSWYIFVILALYVITFVSFFPIRWVKSERFYLVSLLAATAMSLALVYVLMKVKGEHCWYDTLILYMVGMWYSYLKKPIEKVLMKNDFLYFLLFGIFLGLYIFMLQWRWECVETYTIWALCFTVLTVMVTMKVQVNSRILDWFGDHVFSIYILQRIPMSILATIPYFASHPYAYMVCVFAAVIPLAIGYDYLTGQLSKLIWGRKKKTALSAKETAAK